jgi:hypothetical protein
MRTCGFEKTYPCVSIARELSSVWIPIEEGETRWTSKLQ